MYSKTKPYFTAPGRRSGYLELHLVFDGVLTAVGVRTMRKVLVAGLLGLLVACGPKESGLDDTVYLNVIPAVDQPESNALGRIVWVEAVVPKDHRLRIRTEGAEHLSRRKHARAQPRASSFLRVSSSAFP